MRLLWLSDSNTAHTERWVRALLEHGHDVAVFSFAAPKSETLARLPGVTFRTLGVDPSVAYSTAGGIRKLRYLAALPKVHSLVREFKPDLVHAHYASSYGLLAALLRFRPWVLSVWGADVYTVPARSWLHRAAVSWVIRSADVVLSTSHTMRRHTLTLVDRHIDVVPFGIDVQRFVPAPADGACERRVLRIGTVKSLETKYGIEYLLSAFALYKSRDGVPEASLVIGGGGSLRNDLERRARELGIGQEVRFIGTIEYQRVHEVHQSLDIAVYPSIDDSESFGVSVVESQACGQPVIVSRVGGLPEVVEEGLTGLVVPPRDASALCAALVQLASNPDLRRKMGSEGRRRVVEHYDLRECVAQLVRHYESILAGHIRRKS